MCYSVCFFRILVGRIRVNEMHCKTSGSTWLTATLSTPDAKKEKKCNMMYFTYCNRVSLILFCLVSLFFGKIFFAYQCILYCHLAYEGYGLQLFLILVTGVSVINVFIINKHVLNALSDFWISVQCLLVVSSKIQSWQLTADCRGSSPLIVVIIKTVSAYVHGCMM